MIPPERKCRVRERTSSGPKEGKGAREISKPEDRKRWAAARDEMCQTQPRRSKSRPSSYLGSKREGIEGERGHQSGRDVEGWDPSLFCSHNLIHSLNPPSQSLSGCSAPSVLTPFPQDLVP